MKFSHAESNGNPVGHLTIIFEILGNFIYFLIRQNIKGAHSDLRSGCRSAALFKVEKRKP